MLQFTFFLLATLFYGALASSPIVDFQEKFGELSHDFQFVVQEYRVKNHHVRNGVVHRILDGLGNLTVEMRDITADYWAQIEAHQYASEECLEMIRPDFDYYVEFASLDIQDMAGEMDRFLMEDAYYRFNPILSFAQRENTRALYQTIQTLGRSKFFPNMVDTLIELQEELEYYRNVRGTFQEMLDKELEYVEGLRYRVEQSIEWWHEFTVSWHHVFMVLQLARVEHYCGPDVIEVKGTIRHPTEAFSAKLKELEERKSLTTV